MAATTSSGPGAKTFKAASSRRRAVASSTGIISLRGRRASHSTSVGIYSWRSEIIGSTSVARRAGKYAASAATNANTAAATARERESWASMP